MVVVVVVGTIVIAVDSVLDVIGVVRLCVLAAPEVELEIIRGFALDKTLIIDELEDAVVVVDVIGLEELVTIGPPTRVVAVVFVVAKSVVGDALRLDTVPTVVEVVLVEIVLDIVVEEANVEKQVLYPGGVTTPAYQVTAGLGWPTRMSSLTMPPILQACPPEHAPEDVVSVYALIV